LAGAARRTDRQGAADVARRPGRDDRRDDDQPLVRALPAGNVGVATGAPGPEVLDVDDPEAARDVDARLPLDHIPTAATARGQHLYFAGQDRGTVNLGYGELRGHGSFVVAVPSVHASGKSYVWTNPPRPGAPLMEVPSFIVGAAATAGCGEHRAPAGRVPHGQRHDYLKDFTVRLLRAGITDERRVAEHLRCEFEASCATTPPAKPGYFDDLARWASQSRIAGRERRAL
jgi:Bifunctional DNA primase/polymerase, N-terminal